MVKRTHSSVTEELCCCDYLERAAIDPESPIEFDTVTNEYQFKFQGPGGKGKGSLIIYHCPFCGGAAPESLRSALFETVTSSERERLDILCKDIYTLDDAINILGRPDQDDPKGVIVQSPEKDGNPPSTRSYRTLTYENLSKTVAVHITDYLKDRVFVEYQGKCIESKSGG